MRTSRQQSLCRVSQRTRGSQSLLSPEAGGNALGDTPVFWEATSWGRARPELSFWQLLGSRLWAKGLLGAGMEISIGGATGLP